jgi:hypothetical protein
LYTDLITVWADNSVARGLSRLRVSKHSPHLHRLITY